MNARKTISIVVPVYNEAENIETSYKRLAEVMATLQDRYLFEIIFTDNHSQDGSFEIISRIAQRDPRVRGVRFARNYGFHRSVLTGYRMAGGAAAVQIDCDLQDPPEVIPEFVRQWEAGHDLVVGVRRTRDDGQALQWARNAFYRMLRRLSDDDLVIDSGDFRLLDRRILDELHWIDDAVPYLRGLTTQLAGNQGVVLYDRRARVAGKSKFPLKRLVALAVDGLLAHSTFPLRVATYIGLLVSCVTFGLSLIYVFGRVLLGADWPVGFATTTVLLLLGISLNAIFLGIIGEYVGRIYNQIRKRPTTVIERSVNITVADHTGGARGERVRMPAINE